MSMNNNKIDYYFENRDILKYKIEKNIFDNIHLEEEVRETEKYLFKNSTEIEIENFSEQELKEFEIIDNIKKLSTNYDIKIYSKESKRYKEIFKGYNIKFEDYPLFEGYRKEKN